MPSLTPITDACRWLSGEFGVDREEAQKHLGPMLTDALVSDRWAVAKDGRMAIGERGRALLADQDKPRDEE